MTAMERPEWFRVEYSTEPVNMEFLAELERRYEGEYEAAKLRQAEQKQEASRALRQELKDQDRKNPDLERRFKAQEAAREKREQAAEDERERQKLENRRALYSGWHA